MRTRPLATRWNTRVRKVPHLARKKFDLFDNICHSQTEKLITPQSANYAAKKVCNNKPGTILTESLTSSIMANNVFIGFFDSAMK
jgi:hypothetical protein